MNLPSPLPDDPLQYPQEPDEPTGATDSLSPAILDPSAEPQAIQVLVTSRYCCDPNERVFEALWDAPIDSTRTTCRWEFGDGTGGAGCTQRHRYDWAGTYTTWLTVTLDNGATMRTSVEVKVGLGPVSTETADPADGPDHTDEVDPSDPIDDTPINIPEDDENQINPEDDDELPIEEIETSLAIALDALAGPDLEVTSGQRVVLSGSVTVDPPTATVEVLWKQRLGPMVTIEEADTVGASFTAPAVTRATPLLFTLTAKSGRLRVESRVTITTIPTRDEVRADDPRWDYDPADATAAIQGAIQSGAGTVIIPNIGRPWIVRPITLRSDLRLIIEPNAVIEAKKGSFHGSTDALLMGNNVSNVTIEGTGATLRMHKPDYTSLPYSDSEWRHGLALLGALQVQVLGLRIEQSGGDGLYIGPSIDERHPCRNVVVRDCVFVGNYRNGMGIVSVENLTVEGCTILETSGTAPQAGLLVEPSDHGDRIVNVRVRNCLAKDNAGTGFMTNLSKLGVQSAAVDVVVENCIVQNSVQPGLRAILREDQGATGSFEFVNCQVVGTRYAGAKVIWDVRSAIAVRFRNCLWHDVATRVGEPVLEFDLTGGGFLSTGEISFNTSTISNNHGRDLVKVVPSDGTIYPQISGTIAVLGNRPNEGIPPVFPNLVVAYSEDDP